MSELILHHYEASPFSEKVRLALGFKGLSWRSVRIPAVMPKPDVVALTGGYRRTPILQIGNHVHCDTALILRVLERTKPAPTLYPDPLVEVLSEWADTMLFDAAASISKRPTTLEKVMQLLTPDELMRFRDDRVAMTQGARRAFPAYATSRAHFAVYLARLEALLEHRPFLAPSGPSVADFSAYHPIWFMDMLAPEVLSGFERVRAWRERVAAVGHGHGVPMTSEEALAVCRNAGANEPDLGPSVPDVTGLSLGDAVTVCASDYARDPVEGELACVRPNEIVIARDDDRAGRVFVHFPRLGYDVRAR